MNVWWRKCINCSRRSPKSDIYWIFGDKYQK